MLTIASLGIPIHFGVWAMAVVRAVGVVAVDGRVLGRGWSMVGEWLGWLLGLVCGRGSTYTNRTVTS